MYNSSITLGHRTIGDTSNEFINQKILTPDIQRMIDTDKVNSIVAYQTKYYEQHKRFNFIGVISICNYDGQLLIIDGQHRYTAYKKLYAVYPKCSLIVEVITVKSYDELKDNYCIINKNTQLPSFDSLIMQIKCEKIAKYFFDKPYLWTNKRANRPWVNKNEFIQSIETLARDRDEKDIIVFIESMNKKYSSLKIGDFCDGKEIKKAMLMKCNNSGFYLGLFSCKDNSYKYFTEINKKPVLNKRPVLNKSLRMACWNKYIGKKTAAVKCICCQSETIYNTDFHAGHILAVAKQGTMCMNNILPICSICNLSMGSQLMDDFVKNNFPDNLDNYFARKYTLVY